MDKRSGCLTLFLFVTWVFADNPNDIFAFDDAALLAKSFY